MKTLKHFGLLLLVSCSLGACRKQCDISPVPLSANPVNTNTAKGTAVPDTLHVTYIYIGSINQGYGSYSPFYGYSKYRYLGEYANVMVVDQHNNQITTVNVTGNWTGCYSLSSSSSTWQVKGSGSLPTGCTSTFTVTGISASGYVYKPAANAVNSGMKLYP